LFQEDSFCRHSGFAIFARDKPGFAGALFGPPSQREREKEPSKNTSGRVTPCDRIAKRLRKLLASRDEHEHPVVGDQASRTYSLSISPC
jgi:hypothetical protein